VPPSCRPETSRTARGLDLRAPPERADLNLVFTPMDDADRGFRIGASHAAGWIAETVKTMEAAKATTPEISQVVHDYMNVLVDWREEQVEMPKGNPWSWSYEELQDYIKRRRKEW
jgi:hypothetical protein